jgi:hypothetical protein
VKLILLAFAALSGWAADLTGIWSGPLPNRFGETDDISFRFEQKGTSLGGKLYGDNDSTPIAEGVVSGDTVTFIVTLELNGGSRKFAYTGKIEGDTLKMERRRVLLPGDPNPPGSNRNQPQTFILKRIL